MIKSLIENLKKLEGRVICLLFCLLPLFLHTAYVIIKNENEEIPKWITIPTGILFALGFESTILVFTLTKNRTIWFRTIPYIFAILSLIINWIYSRNNFLGHILAFSLVFSVLVYSDLIKFTEEEDKPKRRRRNKEDLEVEQEQEILVEPNIEF